MRNSKLTMGLAIALGLVACKKKDTNPQPAPKTVATPPAQTGSGSAAEGSGSAAATQPAEAVKPMTGAELADMYKKCSSEIDDAKWDDLKKDCLADDITVHEGSMDNKGADSVVAMLTAMKTAFPDIKHEPQLILVNGRNIFAATLITGTNDGALQMPGMPAIPATHKKIGFMMFHRLTVNDANKAGEEWDYLDPSTMMAQLGLMPKSAPPKRPAMEKGMEGAPVVAVAADDDKEKANVALVEKGTAAFNAHKIADLVAMMDKDAVESDQADPADQKGKKAIEGSLKMFMTAFSDVQAKDATAFGAGDYVVSLGTLDGTNDHDMGKMKKTGKHISQPYAEVFEIKDGKVKNLWRFYDSMQIAQQLGLMPGPGAAPASEGGEKPADEKPAEKHAAKKPAKK